MVSTYPSEKWWSSSVGMMTSPIYGKIKFMFQTTNQDLMVICEDLMVIQWWFMGMSWWFSWWSMGILWKITATSMTLLGIKWRLHGDWMTILVYSNPPIREQKQGNSQSSIAHVSRRCFPILGWIYLHHESPLNYSNHQSYVEKLPSGKRLHNYGKSPFSMGKSTISTRPFSIAM